jgi:flagellar basal-body rod modification protein FlgD
LDGGELGKGEQHLNWDGTGDDGAALPAGTYTFEVRATDGAGATVAVTPLMRGTVDRVTFSQGGILLWIGDESVAMGNVRSVLG